MNERKIVKLDITYPVLYMVIYIHYKISGQLLTSNGDPSLESIREDILSLDENTPLREVAVRSCIGLIVTANINPMTQGDVVMGLLDSVKKEAGVQFEDSVRGISMAPEARYNMEQIISEMKNHTCSGCGDCIKILLIQAVKRAAKLLKINNLEMNELMDDKNLEKVTKKFGDVKVDKNINFNNRQPREGSVMFNGSELSN